MKKGKTDRRTLLRRWLLLASMGLSVLCWQGQHSHLIDRVGRWKSSVSLSSSVFDGIKEFEWERWWITIVQTWMVFCFPMNTDGWRILPKPLIDQTYYVFILLLGFYLGLYLKEVILIDILFITSTMSWTIPLAFFFLLCYLKRKRQEN